MAVRIRAEDITMVSSGKPSKRRIICAAKSVIESGDVYIDDGLHYVLGVEMCVLSVCGLTPDGAELWEFHAPISLNEKIAKEQAVRAEDK